MDEIRSSQLLLVEGADDKHLCIVLMDRLAVTGLYVDDACGKDNLRPSILGLHAITGFWRLQKVGIMRDADSDADAAFVSVCGSLRDAGFPVPSEPGQFTQADPTPYKPCFGVCILPGNRQPGMIEDMCVASVSGLPAFKCVESFTECVEALSDPPSNVSKSKALAFMATQGEVCGDIGLAATKGYWNFDAPCFEPLKSFLLNFK